jgi:hypothetical protein
LILEFINNTFTNNYSGSTPIIAIYFGIFILAVLFQFAGSLDAYFSSNTMLVLTVSIFNFICVIYSVAQIFQTRAFYNCLLDFNNIVKTSSNPLLDILNIEGTSGCYFLIVDKVGVGVPYALIDPKTIYIEVQKNMHIFYTIFKLQYAIMIIMIIFNGIGFFFSYKAYQEYGWNNFLEQGASRSKRRVNIRYQLFIICLKLNIFVHYYNFSFWLALWFSITLRFISHPSL